MNSFFLKSAFCRFKLLWERASPGLQKLLAHV